MGRSYEVARELFAAHDGPGDLARRIRMFPFLLGLLNLFFCGYFNHYLDRDAGGHYLCLFFFLEASLCWVLSLVFLFQRGREVLAKTTVYPLPPWSRMVYALRTGLTGPLFRALLLTTVLFLVVVYWSRPPVMALALLLFCLLMANSVVVAALLLVLSARSRSAAGAPALAFALIAGAVILIAVFFQMQDVLVYTPGAAWAAGGVVAAQAGRLGEGLLDALALLGTFVLATLAGRVAA